MKKLNYLMLLLLISNNCLNAQMSFQKYCGYLIGAGSLIWGINRNIFYSPDPKNDLKVFKNNQKMISSHTNAQVYAQTFSQATPEVQLTMLNYQKNLFKTKFKKEKLASYAGITLGLAAILYSYLKL